MRKIRQLKAFQITMGNGDEISIVMSTRGRRNKKIYRGNYMVNEEVRHTAEYDDRSMIEDWFTSKVEPFLVTL